MNVFCSMIDSYLKYDLGPYDKIRVQISTWGRMDSTGDVTAELQVEAPSTSLKSGQKS